MAEPKKIPVVKQYGEEIQLNRANAYRTQYLALLELLGINSMDELHGLSDDAKQAIPIFPPYDEISSSSSRFNAATSMMKIMTDNTIGEAVQQILDRVLMLPTKEELLNQINDRLDYLPTREDVNSIVQAHTIDPSEIREFMQSVNTFIARHAEFVAAFTTFVSASSNENESESTGTSNADVLAAVNGLKDSLVRINDVSVRGYNAILDILHEMDDNQKMEELHEVKTPEYTINIHGDNHGPLNIGTASGCNDHRFFSGDDACEDECAAVEDSDNDEDTSVDDISYDEPSLPRASAPKDDRTYSDRRPGFFSTKSESKMLCEKGGNIVVPEGIVDDIRMIAFCYYTQYFKGGTYQKGLSIFTIGAAEMNELNKYYNHSAVLTFIRDLSGGATYNFSRLIRNEIVRLVVAIDKLSPDELLEFILDEATIAFSAYLDDANKHNADMTADALNKRITDFLEYDCEKLENDLPDMREYLMKADRVIAANPAPDSHILSIFLHQDCFINSVYAYRKEDVAVTRTGLYDYDDPLFDGRLFKDLSGEPESVQEEAERCRSMYFLLNLLLQGNTDDEDPFISNVHDWAVMELREAYDKNAIFDGYDRIIAIIDGLGKYETFVRPSAMKKFIMKLKDVVKSALDDVLREKTDDIDGTAHDEPKDTTAAGEGE